MACEETLRAVSAIRAVRGKAELLNGGVSLGEGGDLLAEIAIQKALAWCQRGDVPEDMEQAVAVLLLALSQTIPRSADTPENADGSGNGGEAPEEGTPSGSSGSAGNWEALIASGAVKSVQRGDTAITFNTSAAEALSSTLSTNAVARTITVEEALAGLAPWRRLGRLQPPERRPGYGN